MYLSSHAACGLLLDIYFSGAPWQLLMQRGKNHNHFLTPGIVPHYSGALRQEVVSGAVGRVSVRPSLQICLLVLQICKTKAGSV